MTGREYTARPVDVFSCGVVLVALLAGELPWDKPTAECDEYRDWRDNRKEAVFRSPWSKMSNSALCEYLYAIHPLNDTNSFSHL